MKKAVYPLSPYCPDCFTLLPFPDWWSKTEDVEHKTEAVTVFCASCTQPVDAQFFAALVEQE